MELAELYRHIEAESAVEPEKNRIKGARVLYIHKCRYCGGAWADNVFLNMVGSATCPFCFSFQSICSQGEYKTDQDSPVFLSGSRSKNFIKLPAESLVCLDEEQLLRLENLKRRLGLTVNSDALDYLLSLAE